VGNPIYEVPVSDGDAAYPPSRLVPPSPAPAFTANGDPVAPAAFAPSFDSLLNQDAPVQPPAFPTTGQPASYAAAPPPGSFPAPPTFATTSPEPAVFPVTPEPPTFATTPAQDAAANTFPGAAAFPPPSFGQASDIPAPPTFAPPTFAEAAPPTFAEAAPPTFASEATFTSQAYGASADLPVSPSFEPSVDLPTPPAFAPAADLAPPVQADPVEEAKRAHRAPQASEVPKPEFEFSTKQSPIGGVDADLLHALREVVRLGASDLHVSSNAQPMTRIDGALTPVPDSVTWSRSKVQSALESIVTTTQQEQFDEVLELDFAYSLSADSRFRVNFYQQRGAIGAAFRLIPSEIKRLHDLGVPEVVGRFATLPRGLVLVTGPTGSGKSTTLAALIDLVNRTRTDHIVTVEDPIEFMHTNHKSLVNQREVGADTHSFANALKHVLRQDPDVILIGELRDLETISVALTAAETGHLVFATLHTQDAAQTIDRVIDVFPPHQQGQVRAQLAATLQGVVCQTLVKRAGGAGRAVATEVLVTTPAVANLIREGKTYQIESAMQAGRELGMHTMDQHLAELVNNGQVTYEAALEKIHDLDGFKRLVHRAPVATDDTSFNFTEKTTGRF